MPLPLSDVREPVNALFYGDGGTGKTTDALAMAHEGKVLAVNAESGIKARALAKLGIPVENIEIFPEPGQELTFELLESEWKRVYEELNKDPNAYAGFVMDSITEVYKALLDNVVSSAVVRASRAGKDRDPFFIDRADYGIMTEQVRKLIRKFRDLPCHFAVTALSRREQDDDGSVVYQPAVTPALQNDLVGWMDLVCATSVVLVEGEEEHRGLFRPHAKFRGKDRLGAMPKWLVDPTFDRIVQYAGGDLSVDDDPVMQAAKERAALAKEKEIKEKSE